MSTHYAYRRGHRMGLLAGIVITCALGLALGTVALLAFDHHAQCTVQPRLPIHSAYKL